MKTKLLNILLVVSALLIYFPPASAQTTYTLQKLQDAALQINHLLHIKELQVQEKNSKLKEDNIKKYPVPQVDGTYQYNFKLPDITIPAGVLGAIPLNGNSLQLLPAQPSRFSVGQKDSYNIGLSLYQPLTQQFRIDAGQAITKIDLGLLQTEKEKATSQLRLLVKQLFYQALITEKQIELETNKLLLAQIKLLDATDALKAGKAVKLNLSGLQADIAAQEQSRMKFTLQLQDQFGELTQLTNTRIEKIVFDETIDTDPQTVPVDDYKIAAQGNKDMRIARLNVQKAALGIKEACLRNLPDIGIVAGYYVQQGNPVLPQSSPYVGVSLKWNLQDIFADKHLTDQRRIQYRQAEENLAFTRQQVETDIDKAWRRVRETESMISVARKVVAYRSLALKEQ